MEVGSRVRLKPEIADGYIQPWRDRIKRGLKGEVTKVRNDGNFDLRLDMPKRAKWPHDWIWNNLRPGDIEPIED